MASEVILGRSLSSDMVVGSNLRGRVSGGGWLYALPRLAFGRAVCVGVPAEPTLAALARAAARVLVLSPDAHARTRLAELAEREGWAGVTTAAGPEAAATGATDATGDAGFDLLVVAGRAPAAWAERTAAGLALVLAPACIAYVEPARRLAAIPWSAPVLELRVTPRLGETRAIVPAGDAAMHAAFRRLGLDGTIPRRPILSHIGRRLGPFLAGRLAARSAAVVGEEYGRPAAPPRYVREVAAAGGYDLSGWRWGVAARGDYDTQKVLILLAPPGEAVPTGLVKVTRAAELSARLENETAALSSLSALPIAAGRTPAAWFAGRHAGRALLGESLVLGCPFSGHARWTPDCPGLADALGWLDDLGAATARPASSADVAGALLALLDRYDRVYRPASAELHALRSQFETIGGPEAPVPTVFQHGDPGIWNLLVDARGRTVFLDWESAEPLGMPLWDALYFFRSYAIAASRRAGVRDRLEAASRHLLNRSVLGDRFVSWVHDHRRRIGLQPDAVEPLVYGCWVHRSLKEATRLPPDRLDEGQFVRLVRRMIATPDAPTLVRLREPATAAGETR